MNTVGQVTEQIASSTLQDASSRPEGLTMHDATSRPRGLTLRKDEKLRHKSLIDPLFKEGRTLYDYPLRLSWRVVSPEQLADSFRDTAPDNIGPLQMLITVPKKKRRHAVDRVLMRRRIREAYRLNRLPLKHIVEGNPAFRTLGIAIIYLSDKNLPYSTVEAKMKNLLSKLEKTLANEQTL